MLFQLKIVNYNMVINIKKYYSYKEAYNLMVRAINNGFFFEAITIQESIISDRLLSFVVGKKIIEVNENEIHKNKVSLGNLIIATKDYMTGFDSLHAELLKFKNQRNICVHSLVKSYPGKPTVDVVDIITLAKETSTNGEKLTREVLKWHKHEKNKSVLKNKSLRGQLKMN